MTDWGLLSIFATGLSIAPTIDMEKNYLTTDKGRITYRTFRPPQASAHGQHDRWLVFLPGLSADHRLFERQTEYFAQSWNCLVWDPPAHGESRPFGLDFTMDNLAGYLHQILEKEGIARCVLIGQSFGGYVAQAFISRYSGVASGFVSIDSAPLVRQYYSKAERWLLKHTYGFYMCFPWKLLIKSGAYSCAETRYGRELMRTTMLSYGKKEYCRLAAAGYRILSEQLSGETHAPDCPVLLICGKKDRQITNIYSRKWAAEARLQVHWVEGAGHNANTDRPDIVNDLIETFLTALPSHQSPPR